MKRGDKVAVCYDGKFSRRVLGEVVSTHNGHHISVKFTLWASKPEKKVTAKFRVKRRPGRMQRKYFGGWVKHDDALMPRLFGAPGDWYSVHKWEAK